MVIMSQHVAEHGLQTTDRQAGPSGTPRCASLVAIYPFVWQKRLALNVYRRTDRRTTDAARLH